MMKGMVFTLLADMIESEFGIQMWDALIDQTAPASDGVYTSVEVYPDQEFLAYVHALSEKTNLPANTLVHAFGTYLIGRFASIHPEFFEDHDAKSFLKSVHDVIHVEVKKLHPGVVLPEFEYEDPAPDALVMNYHSPRRLCSLAEGLIEGAARHFETTIDIEHEICMHQGAEYCRLSLKFAQAEAINAA